MINVKFEDGINGHLLASFAIPAGVGHLLIGLTRSHKDAAERFDADAEEGLSDSEKKEAAKKADADEAKEHAEVVAQAKADRKEAAADAKKEAAKDK